MSSEHEETAAAWGIIAASDAIAKGQALNHPPEQIAEAAHVAAAEAHQKYLDLAAHEVADEAVSDGHVGQGKAPSSSPRKKHRKGRVGLGAAHPTFHPAKAFRPPHGGSHHPAIHQAHAFQTPPHAAPHNAPPHHAAPGPHAHATPHQFGGGGGGGHHHHGHDHGGGGGGGGGGDFDDFDGLAIIEETPILELCLPDQVLLPTGECFPPRVYPLTVGHGHGGGHGGHGHGFGGGGWWGGYWGPPIVYACGPGQVLLANGTCFTPASYGLDPGLIEVGRPIPWGEQIKVGEFCCPVDEDGNITLPDGSTVHVDGLDWSEVDEAHDAVHVGAAAVQSQTGITGAQYVQQLAQTLDNEWQQVSNAGAQAVHDGKITSAQWGQFQTDYQQWETWFQQAKASDALSVTNPLGGYGPHGEWWNSDTLNQYTNKLVGWYNTFQKADPAAIAANTSLPGPTPDTSALGALSSAGQALVTVIEYAVIGVAIAAGVYLLWPVLTAGAAKAAAAL